MDEPILGEKTGNESPIDQDGIKKSMSPWANNVSSGKHDDSGHSSGEELTMVEDEMPKTSVDDGKHSLFQFALQHFRGAKERATTENGSLVMQKSKKKKGSKDNSEWTWKELVKYF